MLMMSTYLQDDDVARVLIALGQIATKVTKGGKRYDSLCLLIGS